MIARRTIKIVSIILNKFKKKPHKTFKWFKVIHLIFYKKKIEHVQGGDNISVNYSQAIASSIKVTFAKWAVFGIPRHRIPWACRHSFNIKSWAFITFSLEKIHISTPYSLQKTNKARLSLMFESVYHFIRKKHITLTILLNNVSWPFIQISHVRQIMGDKFTFFDRFGHFEFDRVDFIQGASFHKAAHFVLY